MRFTLTLLTATGLFGFAMPAFGQANERKECSHDYSGMEQEIDEGYFDPATCSIVVTGNLLSSKAEVTETIITAPKQEATVRLEQSLSAIAGLQQFRRSDARSANPTSQGVTMRGLGGNAASRTLMFLDDVPQADPFGGWVSWPGYDAMNLASVRVRKGGGQAAAGPGSVAGVIELDSFQYSVKDYPADGRYDRDSNHTVPFANLALSYGSRDSFEGRGNVIQRLGNGTISASGSYSRGNGFVPIIESQRGPVDRAAPYEQGGLAIRMVAPLNDDVELQGNVRGYIDDRDRGVDFSANSNEGIDASLRLVDRRGDWQWSTTGYVQVRDFSSQFGAVSADRSTVTPTLNQFATPSTGLGLRFELRPPLGEKVELRLGWEWRRTLGETRENFTFVSSIPTRFRTAGGQTDIYGGFVEANVEPFYGLTISAGGRLDRWQISDGFRREVNIGGTVRSDDRFLDRRGTEWTARTGIAYVFADPWSLKGSAYTAWRLPTLNELYRPFRVGADATAANEALNPERVKGVEVSLSYDAYYSKANLTIFYNQLDNAIANVTLGRGAGNFPGVGFVAAGGVYRQRQNLASIVSQGVELDGRFQIIDGLVLNLSYAYVDSRVEAGDSAFVLDGLRPAQVPKHFANAGLNYTESDSYADNGWWSASFALRYTGGQFEDDTNIRQLKNALTVDAMVRYRFDQFTAVNGLSVELRSENVLNARIEAAISGTGVIERASPRTLWIGLRKEFH